MEDGSIPIGTREPAAQPAAAATSADDPRAAAESSKQAREREQEMQKVAAVGQKRFEREARIKQRLKDEQASRNKRWQAAAKEEAERKEAKKDAAAGYRKTYRQREKDIADEKRRREKIRLDMEAKEKAKAEERKKQAQYMGELHEQARIKGEAQRKKLQAEEEHDRLTREAQRKFRARIEQLDHEYAASIENASTEAQAHKVVIQNSAQQKLYSLEGWHRMRVSALDSDMRSKLAAAGVGVSALKAEDRRATLNAQSRNAYRLIEKEFAERRADIEMDVRMEKIGVENGLKMFKDRADQNLRLQKRKAEIDLARTLEDLSHADDKKKKPSSHL
jgi:hypothetical protein